MERVVYMQLIEYLETNELIHPSHHGFRANHSTATALLQMQDKWLESFDKGELSAVLALDMSAAFDLVDHGLLLEKLKIYNIEDNTVKWVASYLEKRT